MTQSWGATAVATKFSEGHRWKGTNCRHLGLSSRSWHLQEQNDDGNATAGKYQKYQMSKVPKNPVNNRLQQTPAEPPTPPDKGDQNTVFVI